MPDIRMERPELFQRGRKPVGNVKIDWTHPLTDGLILCAIGNFELVHNFPVSKIGSKLERGCIIHDDITDYTILESGVDSVIPTEEITIALGYEKTDATHRSSSAFGFNSESTEFSSCRAILPFSDSTVYWDFAVAVDALSGRAIKTGLSFGDDNWMFTSSVINDSMKIFQNGVDTFATETSANTRVISATKSFNLGVEVVNSDLAKYKYFYVYKYEMGINRARSLNDSPYQFLIPA